MIFEKIICLLAVFIAAAIFKVGEYTQIACSLATLFAGCFSALCNVLLFKNHRPFILHAFVFILVTEVIHMGIVPLTHLDELQDATMVMYACFLPLLLVNAITVVFCCLFSIVVAFIAKTCVISILYDRMALENTQKNFSAELNAMKNLILKDSNRYGYDFKEMAYEYIDD